jgi:hypothetical protein
MLQTGFFEQCLFFIERIEQFDSIAAVQDNARMREKSQDDAFEVVVGGFANYTINDFAVPDVDAVKCADGHDRLFLRVEGRYAVEYFQTYFLSVANLTILF